MVPVVLLAVSLGATAGDREDVEMLQIQSRPRMPVIVDTDMDTDDQMALAFLLGEPSIEVKAITTLADGWSNQWSGVQNAMRLTQAWGQPDIPVAYSTRYNGDTQLNMMQPNDLPNPTLLTGIGNFLSEFVPLPFNVRPPSWMYASRLIRETLRNSEHKVDIIELGPLTNLAQVLQEEPELFREKVRRLYMSGGLIVGRSEEGISEVWPYSSGPDGTSFTGKPPGTSWNIFSDPIAANSVFSFGVPLVIGSSEYEDENQFSTNDTSFIPSSCPLKTAEFLRRAITMLPVANNESESELKYWDESLAVLAIQMIRHHGRKDAAVCKKWERKRFAVMMEAGNDPNVSGGRYSRLLENPFGQRAVQCVESNETEFKTAYYSGICGIYYESPANQRHYW